MLFSRIFPLVEGQNKQNLEYLFHNMTVAVVKIVLHLSTYSPFFSNIFFVFYSFIQPLWTGEEIIVKLEEGLQRVVTFYMGRSRTLKEKNMKNYLPGAIYKLGLRS